MKLRMTRTLLALCLAAACAVCEEPAARSNRELFDEACRRACAVNCAENGIGASSSVFVSVAEGERTPSFRAPVMETLASLCKSVYTVGLAIDTAAPVMDASASLRRTVETSGLPVDTALTISVEHASVQYGPGFREGWFGSRKTERTVSVGVRIEAVSAASGRVLFARTITHAVRDTILVDEIASANASASQIAVGRPPGPSLWERILEPAILTVSSGIAVYLFFTVRS